MADPYTLLLNMQIIEAIIAVYENLIGEWFYAIGLLAILLMIYLKSQSIVPTAIVGILSGTVMSILLPGLFPLEAQQIGVLFIALGISAILYHAYASR